MMGQLWASISLGGQEFRGLQVSGSLRGFQTPRRKSEVLGPHQAVSLPGSSGVLRPRGRLTVLFRTPAGPTSFNWASHTPAATGCMHTHSHTSYPTYGSSCWTPSNVPELLVTAPTPETSGSPLPPSPVGPHVPDSGPTKNRGLQAECPRSPPKGHWGRGPRDGSPGGPPGPGSLPAFQAATHSSTYPQKLHTQPGQASSFFPPTSRGLSGAQLPLDSLRRPGSPLPQPGGR